MTNERKRLRREDPVRTGPIRNWATLYRSAPQGNSGTTAREDEDKAKNNTVTRGVELGYRVIGDYLKQGQRIAQQMNSQSYSLGKMNSDVRELTERVFRDTTELLSVWFETLNAAAANTERGYTGTVRGFSPAGTMQNGVGPDTAPSNGKAPPRQSPISLEVVAFRPTQVTIDLYPQSEGRILITHGLRSVEPTRPPLTEIVFSPANEEHPTRVRIVVPQEQPPDLYTGVVLDKNTGHICGTLSVQIS